VDKVAIFIDGNNLYHGMKDTCKITRIDFRKFTNKLAQGYQLIKTYYYNSPCKQETNFDKYKSQQRFFAYLKSLPRFEVILGRLEKRIITIEPEIFERIKDIHPQQSFETFVEKGVDVNLAIDMLKLAFLDYYDTAILVSGDGDYVSAVNAVQELGKKVINAYFQNEDRAGYHLRKRCDEFILLDSKFIKSCR